MGNKVLLDTFEYAPLSNRVRNLHVLFGPEDKTNKVLFIFITTSGHLTIILLIWIS